MPEIDPLTGERKASSQGNYKIDPATGERIEDGGTPSQHPYLDAAKDFGKGLLKSGLSTISSADEFAQKHLPAFMTTPIGQAPTAENSARAVAAAKDLATPNGRAQTVGKVVGDAAQFLIPGDLEAAGAAKLTPYLGKVGSRMATAALGSGIVNKAEGGSFGMGAAAGGVGSGVASAVSAVAPHIAESAMNIRRLDRAYKAKNAIGKAILNETKGFTPGAVADSAQGALDALNPQLEAAADGATKPVSLDPARLTVQNAVDKAASQGERTTFSQLQPVAEHLDKTIFGVPIPSDVTAREALNLKRGIGNEFVNRWNPETMAGVKGTAAQAYNNINQEFLKSVPEAGELSSRISSLIPVAKRAEGLELNAPTTSKMLHRLSAHTGALTGGVFGAEQGYRHGGVGGALMGGVAGVALPELITSPTAEMMIARSLYSPAMSRAVIPGLRGLGLQLDRPSNDKSK
jgi:hypothetical protein